MTRIPQDPVFCRDDRGQDLIEYAVIATFVALLAIIGASALSSAVGTLYDHTSSKMNSGANFTTNGSGGTSGCTPKHDDQMTPPSTTAPPANPDEAHAPSCK